MIDSQFHVELNGVKYRLAEDAEGQHYVLSGEPLRPPNSAMVQGETEARFHMRPDTLLWTLTDWSGGEGQIKFDPQAPNRWRYINLLQPFDKPGQLLPGRLAEVTQDSTGSSDFSLDGGYLVIQGSTLYAIAGTSAYKWNSSLQRWGSATTISGITTGARLAVGDNELLYFEDGTSGKLYSWDGSSAATQISTGVVSSVTQIVSAGPYLYVYSRSQAKVWEVPKSGATNGIEIDAWDEIGTVTASHLHMTAMGGRIYVMVPLPRETAIREIVPSTAAGAGFGYEHGRIGGLQGYIIWSHGGLLLLRAHNLGRPPALMYYQPDNRTYGTLGEFRSVQDFSTVLSGGPFASDALSSYYATDSPNTDEINSVERSETVVQIDSVSGGFATVAQSDKFATNIIMGSTLVLYRGDLFLGNQGDTSGGSAFPVVRFRYDRYQGTGGFAISPWHDFFLAEEKVLNAIGISCMALPDDGSIKVSYALDGDDTWTEATTYSTNGGTGTLVAVSSSSGTVSFRTISIKVDITTETTDPTILLGIDVLASVVRPQRVWTLLLDLADDRNSKGAVKLASLKTAAATHAVVSFKDGYQSRDPAEVETVSVVVDEYHVNNSRPGEGVAQVRLREVV